jgi:AraC family transcriptional regulator of adaptative response / DNA-3-methyladenine glycosylase II
MRVVLPYRPPYDWAAIAGFLSARATPGVERVDASGYHRTILARGFVGTISVAPMAGADALTVDVAIPDPALVPEIAERVARMFDVDTDPALVAKTLAGDRLLKRACAAHAGIRLPGAWDPFELAVRAILGQQISVRGATTIAGRVVAQWGEPIDEPVGLERLFPSPATLADAPLEKAGIIAARARTIRELARQVADRKVAFNVAADLEALLEIAGIGPWTVQYVAMRALKHADAFPSGDLVLRRMAGDCTPRALDARSERWRPWRAYAVMLLWQAANDRSASPRRKPDAQVDRPRRVRAPRRVRTRRRRNG